MQKLIPIFKLIVKHVEEKKIDINAKNRKGQSAIDVARKYPKLVRLLMKHLK